MKGSKQAWACLPDRQAGQTATKEDVRLVKEDIKGEIKLAKEELRGEIKQVRKDLEKAVIQLDSFFCQRFDNLEQRFDSFQKGYDQFRQSMDIRFDKLETIMKGDQYQRALLTMMVSRHDEQLGQHEKRLVGLEKI